MNSTSLGHPVIRRLMAKKPFVLGYIEPREVLKDALKEFWERARTSEAIVDRLLLLQEFAERLVYTHPRRRYASTRRRHLKIRLRGSCWACRMRPAVHRHHIIQVQYGGLNRSANGVGLCYGCHAVVHPWMRRKA